MNSEEIRTILAELKAGTLKIEDAEADILALLRRAPFEDLGFAKVDHHRVVRQGLPEVIFGSGKTPEQIAAIAERLVAHNTNLLVTRATRNDFLAVQQVVPDAEFHETARAITKPAKTTIRGKGIIGIATAGTSDLPVAEEARVTAEILGNDVDTIYDIGVAGLQRLLSEHKRLDKARVLIVVAGLEGALPSVVGGMVRAPIIAVPTSVGYGASFGGIAALLGMLNTCASGVSVVNIDNGFGAATIASIINHLE
jgi:NCAIR mutase (PurE)-related protein